MHGQWRLALAFLLLGSLHSAFGQDALPAGAKARLGGGGVLNGVLGGEKLSTASLSLDGKLLVAATMFQQSLFDPATGKEVRKLESDPQAAFQGVMLAVAPNSKRVVGLDFQMVRVWDAATGKIIHKIPLKENGGNTPSTLSFSADGKTLATAHITYNQKRAATISIWDIEAGKKLQTIDSIHDLQIHVALSADAKQVASWGRALNNNGGAITNVQSLRIHAAADGKELKQIEVEQDLIRNAAFAPV